MAVGRKDLLRRTSAATGLPESEVTTVVSAFLAEITAALVADETVHIRTFGKFEPRRRPASVRPNPKTGAPMSIPRRRTASFLPSATVREAMNQ